MLIPIFQAARFVKIEELKLLSPHLILHEKVVVFSLETNH